MDLTTIQPTNLLITLKLEPLLASFVDYSEKTDFLKYVLVASSLTLRAIISCLFLLNCTIQIFLFYILFQ